VQPTEQWVQMFLRMVTCAPAGGGGPASALRTLASGSAPSVAVEPAVGLALQGDREAAATSLTFSAFDQHGRLPQRG
jgi:hypothetical protein